MTERRDLAASALADTQRRYRIGTWRIGLALAALSVIASIVAVTSSNGLLGVLALGMVFGGLFWVSLRVLRAANARLHGLPLLPRNRLW